jgi:hypothetical protein
VLVVLAEDVDGRGKRADTLNGLVQEEKDKSDSFVRLPRYFVEISKILLDV